MIPAPSLVFLFTTWHSGIPLVSACVSIYRQCWLCIFSARCDACACPIEGETHDTSRTVAVPQPQFTVPLANRTKRVERV